MSVSTEKRGRREGVTSRQIGRYEVTSALGKGAMGVVYRGHDPLLNRHVAIKIMAASLASDAAVKARFEREAQAAARLAHPSVVTLYDFGYHEGAPFVVMELLRGQDLRTALERGSELSFERRLSIVWQVLSGLAHAHGAGVVHRDVKPANVFLTETGDVKVLDFGMARVTWAGSTGSGSVVGTFDYMSPEQVEARRVDGRSDIFSAGSLLYELLAGQPPFQTDSMVSTAYRIVHSEPDFERLPKTETYAALEPVLRKALAKDPAARYASALEFAADLAAHGGAPWRATLPAPLAPSSRAPDADDEAAAAHASNFGRPFRAPSHGQVWLAAVVLAAAGMIAYGVLRPAPVSAPAAPGLASPSAPPPVARSSTRSTRAPAATSTSPQQPMPPPDAGQPSVVQEVPAAAAPERVASGLPGSGVTAGAVAPAPGRWAGYITDESCKRRGAVSGHWGCAQVCMRKGFRPLLAVDGTLYVIEGIERVQGDRNRMVTVEGTLDPRTNTIRVAGGT